MNSSGQRLCRMARAETESRDAADEEVKLLGHV